MKTESKIIVILVGLLIAHARFASGQSSSFYFFNYFGSPSFNAPVFDAAGNPLAGSNYLAMLYGGPDPSRLSPARYDTPIHEVMAPVPFQRYGLAGFFISTQPVLVPSEYFGGWTWLQVRAWYAPLGPTYESVVSLGLGGYGESTPFYARGGDPQVPTVPARLIGLQSFSLREVIPEPSTWALLAAGGIALWWARRRRAGRDNLRD